MIEVICWLIAYLCCFYSGYLFCQQTTKTTVITKEIPVEVIKIMTVIKPTNCPLYYDNGENSGYEKGYLDGSATGQQVGYQFGYDAGVKVAPVVLVEPGRNNPTYEELVKFLAEDKTNSHAYTRTYVCSDFATDLDCAAESAGFRAGFVFLVFDVRPEGKWGHFMNAFETSDKGLVFVEPQCDGIYTLAVGHCYMNNIIAQIMIVW